MLKGLNFISNSQIDKMPKFKTQPNIKNHVNIENI